MSKGILDALKKELAGDQHIYEEIYKKSKNLAAQAATASGLDIIKKYIRLIERLELEERKKERKVE